MDILKDITITRLQAKLDDALGAVDSLTMNYSKSTIELERENFELQAQLEVAEFQIKHKHAALESAKSFALDLWADENELFEPTWKAAIGEES